MPRSSRSGFATLVAALALGCGPTPERVFVDLGAVDQGSVGASTPVDAPSSTGVSVPGLSVRLGAVPARDVSFGESEERLNAAMELVEQSRAVAYEQVLRTLRESYRAEAQRWTSDRLAQHETLTGARYDAAFAALHAAFADYAEERGPLVVRLAVIAGFPDPDPKSLGKVDPEKRHAVRQAKEAHLLRTNLDALDAAFAKRARGLLEAAAGEVGMNLARLTAEIGAAMREADRRAEEAAAEQMLRTRAGLDALLAQRTSVSLEPERSVEVQLPQSSKTAAAPKVAIPTPTPAALREELSLWLRTRGYVQSPKGKGVRDVTKEFAIWRATHKVGH